MTTLAIVAPVIAYAGALFFFLCAVLVLFVPEGER